MTQVPDIVHKRAHAVGAAKWLDDLPDLLAEIEREWCIAVGRPYQEVTEAFVAEATCEDGVSAVLKLLIPRQWKTAANEITVLRLTHGEGCVQLLRHDVGRGALLLERLGRPLSELGLPVRQRHEILSSVAQCVWRPAPGCGLPTGADKGRWLADFVTTRWEVLDHPCSEQAVEHSLRCAERRIAAHDDERAVLVHGDVQQWNTLEAGDEFKLVDPDGLLAEPEYDLGVVMRVDPLDLLDGDPHKRTRQRAEWLAARTGLDATAIWEWGVVQRVAIGLVCTHFGWQPLGQEMLAVADRIAEKSG